MQDYAKKGGAFLNPMQAPHQPPDGTASSPHVTSGPQKSIFKSMGGSDHSHPHMGFSGPSATDPHASNIHAAGSPRQPGSVIPAGSFGQMPTGAVNAPPDGDQGDAGSSGGQNND